MPAVEGQVFYEQVRSADGPYVTVEIDQATSAGPIIAMLAAIAAALHLTEGPYRVRAANNRDGRTEVVDHGYRSSETAEAIARILVEKIKKEGLLAIAAWDNNPATWHQPFVPVRPPAMAIARHEGWRPVAEIAIRSVLDHACSIDVDLVTYDAFAPDPVKSTVRELLASSPNPRKPIGTKLDPSDPHHRESYVTVALWVIALKVFSSDSKGRCEHHLVTTSDMGDELWFSLDQEQMDQLRRTLDDAGFDANAWLRPAADIYSRWQGDR
jgi:hypothetical protein